MSNDQSWPFWLLGWGHILGGGFFLVYSYLRIRHLQRVTLLHLSSAYFVACTCVFFPLIKYVYPEWSLSDQSTGLRSLFASTIFIAICVCADLVFYRRSRLRASHQLVPTNLSNLILIAVFLFGVIGFVRYFFIGRAVDHLGSVYRAVASGVDYYKSRIAVANELQKSTGLGVVHSQMAVSGIFPVVVGFALLMARSRVKVLYRALAITSVFLSLLIVSVVLQRQSVLLAIGLPILMALLLRRPQDAERRILAYVNVWKLTWIILILVAGGTIAYAWTDAQVGYGTIVEAFGRVFVMPNMVGTWYYSAFPEVFSFRGWGHLFFMTADIAGYDVSTRDVAQYITYYYTMNANSHFLATAYSGAGFSGVFAVVVLYISVVVVADKMFEKASPAARALNILINLCGIISLPNSPIGVALMSASFGYPSVILWLLCETCRRDRIVESDLCLKIHVPSDALYEARNRN